MFDGGSSVDIYGHVLLGRSMHIGTLSHKTLKGRLQQPLARQNAQKCRLQGWLALKDRKTGKLLLRSRVDVVYAGHSLYKNYLHKNIHYIRIWTGSFVCNKPRSL